VAANEVEVFSEYLREQGLKLTSQREVLLRRVLRIKKHFSAEQLFESLRDEGAGISKATVYRTLTLLVESGLLAEHDFERGHKLYERASHQCHHDHLICVGCGRIVEFHNEEIERLQEEIAGRFEFAMVSHTHQIFGQCAVCQGQGKPAARKRR
jgi:Fur family ferric uptake transcriptional regulator